MKNILTHGYVEPLPSHQSVNSCGEKDGHAQEVDQKILSVSALPIFSTMQCVYLRTFKEGFDAPGKVGVPRYVLPIRGNLKLRDKEFRFLEGSLVPRPTPFFFFVLRFAFSIIHGGGKTRKMGKA